MKRIWDPTASHQEFLDSQIQQNERLPGTQPPSRGESSILDLGVRVFVHEGVRKFALIGTTLGG